MANNIAYRTQDGSMWAAYIERPPGEKARFRHCPNNNIAGSHLDNVIIYFMWEPAHRVGYVYHAILSDDGCTMTHYPAIDPTKRHQDAKIRYIDWNNDVMQAEIDPNGFKAPSQDYITATGLIRNLELGVLFLTVVEKGYEYGKLAWDKVKVYLREDTPSDGCNDPHGGPGDTSCPGGRGGPAGFMAGGRN